MKFSGMIKTVACCAAALAGEAAIAAKPMTALETQIAAKHKILVSDQWGGGHRIIFDFNGRKGWIVEPSTTAMRADRPWCWTMQWMGAYINRTGAPALVQKGYCHMHLEAFDRRADDVGIQAFADYQKYLVNELGFAPKTYLIGMSWGGFFSIRYANAHPENVAKIYLDAPLLTFAGFAPYAVPEKNAQRIGPWSQSQPAPGKDWSDDPRMPVNMAASVAKAGIPIYLLYGAQDQTVNPKTNCELFAARFKAAGGDITVGKRGLYGHHPHGFEHEEIGKIVAFFGAK